MCATSSCSPATSWPCAQATTGSLPAHPEAASSESPLAYRAGHKHPGSPGLCLRHDTVFFCTFHVQHQVTCQKLQHLLPKFVSGTLLASHMTPWASSAKWPPPWNPKRVCSHGLQRALRWPLLAGPGLHMCLSKDNCWGLSLYPVNLAVVGKTSACTPRATVYRACQTGDQCRLLQNLQGPTEPKGAVINSGVLAAGHGPLTRRASCGRRPGATRPTATASPLCCGTRASSTGQPLGQCSTLLLQS